jgi:UDP-2,3-diacylglucosamine hydrolase
MTLSKSILFVSDLHLDKNHPEITQKFLQLLSDIKPPVDALYILGDLFESWIGDDCEIPWHNDVVTALRNVTERGVPIYYLHGNRDFLLRKQFMQATGSHLLPDETRLDIYGEPVLIMHGDLLCTRDVGYLKSRKIIRNENYLRMFLLLPKFIREKVAVYLRNKSRKHTSRTAYEIMDVTQEEVVRVMEKNNVACLIHGHTHKPGRHKFQLQQQPAERIVLGAWHEHGNMLICYPSGEKQWMEW